MKLKRVLRTSVSSRMMNIWSIRSSGLVSRNIADTGSRLCEVGGVLTLGVCCRGWCGDDVELLWEEDPELEDEPGTSYQLEGLEHHTWEMLPECREYRIERFGHTNVLATRFKTSNHKTAAWPGKLKFCNVNYYYSTIQGAWNGVNKSLLEEEESESDDEEDEYFLLLLSFFLPAIISYWVVYFLLRNFGILTSKYLSKKLICCS